MKINKEDAERLTELCGEINERVEEFKRICRGAMHKNEYERFRYRCLANLEPGLSNDQPWVVNGVDSLETIAERADEEATGEEEFECPEWGELVGEDGELCEACEDVPEPGDKCAECGDRNCFEGKCTESEPNGRTMN